ncbi:MAG: hypothetical protein HZB55_21185 [Deltaproteobacteria bacterium]|nr:hypothetical protein [Deltaproteobacteria bacterium]
MTASISPDRSTNVFEGFKQDGKKTVRERSGAGLRPEDREPILFVTEEAAGVRKGNPVTEGAGA